VVFGETKEAISFLDYASIKDFLVSTLAESNLYQAVMQQA